MVCDLIATRLPDRCTASVPHRANRALHLFGSKKIFNCTVNVPTSFLCPALALAYSLSQCPRMHLPLD